MLNNAVAVLEASPFRLQARAWLAQVDSNHRPRAYQARALTTWAMSHRFGEFPMHIHTVLKIVGNLFPFWLRIRMRWWRWWDSNPWPPACRAGALPAELHPHISCFANDVAFGKRCELRSTMLPSANVLCNFGICFSPFLKILRGGPVPYIAFVSSRRFFCVRPISISRF